MSPWQWGSWADHWGDACTRGACLSYRGSSDCKRPRRDVTNPIAIILGLILIAALGIDVLLYGNEHMIFLGKKLFELIEWIAFWR
jgi:hypothetical protein